MYSAGTLATLRVASHESWRGVMLFFHRVTCFYTTATSKWVNGTEAIWTQSPKVLLSSPKLISKDSNRKGKSCNVRINIFDSLKKKKRHKDDYFWKQKFLSLRSFFKHGSHQNVEKTTQIYQHLFYSVWGKGIWWSWRIFILSVIALFLLLCSLF